MRPTLPLAIALLWFANTAPADAGTNTRFLDVSNLSHDSVTSLEVAPAGTDAYQQKPLGAPLQGGGDSTTIEIPAEGCLYDMRFNFRNGKTLIYKDVDVCSGRKLAIQRLPRDTNQLVRSEQQMPKYAERHVP